ncbi:protein yippee-like isoform X2 [Triticum aestivum]|uniref:protein yippee-like isoform X2 n=1 Tax=Triticum aestivum TaxID=4565 RepID=UPI001D00646B|nr:protein yippee-like isoform X2 [Triticum aestivum]
MGRLFLTSLAPATGTIYCCKHCDSHLAYAQHIISKMFRCKHGKAYLFDKVVNVVAGESEDDRMMTTGLHTVRDIFCVACGAILGWKYVCNMNLCLPLRRTRGIRRASSSWRGARSIRAEAALPTASSCGLSTMLA